MFAEEFAELDDEGICRYYFVDGYGPLDHYPVLRNMMGVFAVADRAVCLARGALVPKKTCKALTDGAAAKRALAQAVLALGPCLPYTIEVENA